MGFYTPRYGLLTLGVGTEHVEGDLKDGLGLLGSVPADYDTALDPQNLCGGDINSPGGLHLVSTTYGKYLSGPCYGRSGVVQQPSSDEITSTTGGTEGYRVFVHAPGAVELTVIEFMAGSDEPFVSYTAIPVPTASPGLFVFRTDQAKSPKRAWTRFVASYSDGQVLEAPTKLIAAGSSPARAGFSVGTPGLYRISSTTGKRVTSPIQPPAFAAGPPAAVEDFIIPNGIIPNGIIPNGIWWPDEEITQEAEGFVAQFQDLSTPVKAGIAGGVGLGIFALFRVLRR